MSEAEQLAAIISELFASCQEKESRHVDKYGISIVDARCIRMLRNRPKLTVNQLAQEMSVSSSRVTRISDRLVEKALVARKTSPHDRRVFHLTLTREGRLLADRLFEDYLKIHEEILNHFPEENRDAIIPILGNLNVAIKQWLKEN